jgi:hypothetical protein
MCKPNSGAEQRPCIQESTSIGEIWTHHDQGLDAQEGWRIHERGMTESLHTSSNYKRVSGWHHFRTNVDNLRQASPLLCEIAIEG